MIQDPERVAGAGLYIGLISGTSMDGVDAALVSIGAESFSTVATLTRPYPDNLNARLSFAIDPARSISIHEIASLDVEVGRCFADAANSLLRTSNVDPRDIQGLGSHGQTLRHSPESEPPYSVQIGDPATIAALCGIRTVADFRSSDVAYGGQGAPLVPSFHEWRFRNADSERVVLNIGGIANLSVLPADARRSMAGYDTGPGNCLMDEWCRAEYGAPFDAGGKWAASGALSQPLLTIFMDDPYLRQQPPKSTGREHYNLEYIQARLAAGHLKDLPAADVQRTLLQFTVESVATGIEDENYDIPEEIFVCGGGVHNDELLSCLRERLPACKVCSTMEAGLDPDMVEASAFAWFAARRIAGLPVPLTTREPGRSIILGGIYDPTPGQAGK